MDGGGEMPVGGGGWFKLSSAILSALEAARGVR